MILITRPSLQSLATKQLLAKKGLKAICYPMLEIIRIDHEINKAAIDGYTIITSQNAMDSINTDSLSIPQTKYLVVGAKTAKRIAELGVETIISCNDVNSLLELILKQIPATTPLIYYRGEEVNEDIATFLANRGYQNITQKIVYKAVPRQQLNHRLIKMLQNNSISRVLFYSARTAQTFSKLTANITLTQCIAICISENVAKELSTDNWQRIISAATKDEVGILNALEEVAYAI